MKKDNKQANKKTTGKANDELDVIYNQFSNNTEQPTLQPKDYDEIEY
ncbi:hypothetical protein [Bacillus sp. 165]|nr:hypothetical protein [Bacillus sp. 165]MBO9129239.1 hypothetical protein [Bacillus sp. 165]